MSVTSFARHIRDTFRSAKLVVKHSFGVIKKDPQILIYPYLSIIFILLTSSVVGRLVFSVWRRVDHPQIIADVNQAAPHALAAHLGLVAFPVFYTIFVTSYFTCMIAASTLAELEGQHKPMFYGLRVVFGQFFRVTKFAILSIFFFPIAIIAGRQKLSGPRGVFEVVSSSLSLNMSQLAPVVVTTEKGVIETIRDSVNTLGQLWKEGLVIRIGTFGAILVLGSISFLPKAIEHYWFSGRGAHAIGWIITVLLAASSYVVIRVIGTIFTTTLYFEAKNPAPKK